MIRSPKTLIWAMVGVALVAIVVLFIINRPSPIQPLRVRLTWLNQAQFAGLYLAEDQGFYEKEGIQPVISPGGIEYSSVKMVSTNFDDIGLTSADQFLLARAKGVPVVALAAMYQKSPVVLISLKKSGITKPADLRGKKIGFKYGDNTEVPLRALLKKSGINDGDYQPVVVSYDPSPLIDGRVDVFPGFAINELLSLKERGIDVNALYVADYGINFYADVIFTRQDVLERRRTELDRFLKATLAGYQYAIDHPQAAADATLMRLPEARLEHELSMVQVSIPLWKPTPDTVLGRMNLDTWQTIQETLLTFGLLKESLDLHRVVDLDAIQHIQ